MVSVAAVLASYKYKQYKYKYKLQATSQLATQLHIQAMMGF
jgi:hypothetical protein